MVEIISICYSIDYEVMKKQVDDHGKVICDNVRLFLLIHRQGYPVEFIRELVHIDDAVTNLPKADFKSLSKNVAMAFNRIKQALKKDLRNEELQNLVDNFRANPIEEEEEEEVEEEDSDESESDYDSDESESEYDSDDSESESGYDSDSESESDYDSDSESESGYDSDSDYDSDSSDFGSDSSSDSEIEVNPKLTGRAKWVLQPKDIEKERRKEEERRQKEEEKKARKEKLAAEAQEVKEEVIVEETYETPEKLMKSVLSCLMSRSKKSKCMGCD